MNRWRILIFFCLGGLVATPGVALARQLTQTIRGTVVDQATRQPLPGATVVLLPADLGVGTATDDQGVFVLKGIPVGRQSVRVSFTGYKSSVVAELFVISGKELVVNVELEQAPYQLAEVSVSGAAEVVDFETPGRVDISAEQFQRIAANYLDPARIVLSSPSVANTNDQNNAISVRGNSPVSNTWRLEGVEIVNPNHLANAGTISDRPTQNGGGVNVLSTQMLDKSSFLMGYMPAGYGNATGGIFDMYLRTGSSDRREYTGQASLIGLDFAAEGPFKQGGSASYLVNYRYSFTGLLAAMGVDFGGEAIRFQDISLNISAPDTPLGKLTLFGVNGWNSNVFRGPDDPTEWQEDKDLSDIDYSSSIYAWGITQEATLGQKVNLKNVVVYSATDTERSQVRLVPLYDDTRIFNNDRETVSKISFSSSFAGRFGERLSAEGGVKGTAYGWDAGRRARAESTDPDFAGYLPQSLRLDLSGMLLQPYVSADIAASRAIDVGLGMNSSWFGYTGEFFLEPRGHVDMKLSAASTLSLRSGLYSQVLSPFAYHTYSSMGSAGPLPVTPPPNTSLRLMKSWNSEVGWRQTLGESLKLVAATFYQSLFDVPQAELTVGGTSYYYSYMNYDGDDNLTVLYSGGNGRTYGVSAELRQQMVNGFYLWTGGTLYRSEYQEASGAYLPSKFDGRYNFNATLGKEYHKKKSDNLERLFGVHSRLLYQGGFRQQGLASFWTEYDRQLGDYLRLDLRVQWTRFKERYTRLLAIDIQNVLNIENPAYYYYDQWLGREVLKTQLGMIPVIVYRIDF